MSCYAWLIEPSPIKSRFRANAHAAYRRNIMPEHSAHRTRYSGLEKRLTKVGPAAPFALPPEVVLKKVIHVLESPRPKMRYYVTVPSYFFIDAVLIAGGHIGLGVAAD